MKKILCILAVVALIFTFTACSQNNDGNLQSQMEALQSQMADMQNQLEQQEAKITELEVQLEIYENLKNLKDYPKEYDLKIVGDCFAFSFGESVEVPYWEFLQIPNGVVINSEEGIEKLATESYNREVAETPYADAAEFLRLLKTEHYFDGYSFVLANLYHASTDNIIGFASYTIDNDCLKLIFDIENDSPEEGSDDVITKPYIFCIKKIENISNFGVYSTNLVPWYMNRTNDLSYN